ncbi:MAG: hypothetical protein FD174_2089 [Geobacteraceae bacterium]|nr:MAG: hypothetical protein FD174_2089 [Geobacteraceae bacterium]
MTTGKIGNSRQLDARHAKNETLELSDTTVQKKGKIQRTGADQVDISISKAEVEKLKKLANEMPDSRTNKIASLKRQVSRGTYRIDTVVVAEKMLANRRWT